MTGKIGSAARAAALTVAGALVLVGCGSGDGTAGSDGSPEGSDTSLTVFAAASLTDSFNELGRQFEAEHSGVTVNFNYGGSSGLVQQLTEGAPADVFASADTKNMAKLTDAGRADGDPRTFATNTLTVVVPADNPAGIESLDDLQREGVALVVCAPEVPCGNATRKVEAANGIDLKPVSEENAVTDVLGKVTSGQADAGIVYVTDAKSAGDKVGTVELPKADAAVNDYPIVTLKDSGNPQLARQFEELVTGEKGRQVLREAGFGAP